MKNIFLISFAFLLFICVHEAIGQENKCTTKQVLPYSFEYKLQKKPKPEYFEVTADDLKAFEEKYPTGKGKRVNYTPDNVGIWETLPDGRKIWQMAIASKGAKGISLFFENFHIPEGGQLFCYTADRSFVIGPITEPNSFHYDKGNLQINGVPGDSIIIEYNQSVEVKTTAQISITEMWYRFTDFPYGYLNNLPKKVPTYDPVSQNSREMMSKYMSADRPQMGSYHETPKYNTSQHGVWDTLSNGDRIWRVTVKVDLPYSVQVSFCFNNTFIPQGGSIFIYTEDKTISTMGAITSLEIDKAKGSGFCKTLPVYVGEFATIEYYEPKEVIGQSRLELTKCEFMLSPSVGKKKK